MIKIPPIGCPCRLPLSLSSQTLSHPSERFSGGWEMVWLASPIHDVTWGRPYVQGLCSVYLNILFSLMNYTKTNLLFLKREHLGHIFCIPKATCVERGSTVPRLESQCQKGGPPRQPSTTMSHMSHLSGTNSVLPSLHGKAQFVDFYKHIMQDRQVLRGQGTN